MVVFLGETFEEHSLKSVNDIMKNMDLFCCKSKPVCNIVVVCVLIFVRFANDIPQNQQGLQYSWTSIDEMDDTVLATEWINPCGASNPIIEPGVRPRDPKLLNTLKNSLTNFIIRLQGDDMNAIDVSDINDWFKFNSTYSFLHQLNEMTDTINLQERHLETQKYVGALQHLAYNQKKFDILHNEGYEVTIEIQHLFALAKGLLCEIETVIQRTRQPIKTIFTREQMDRLLTFRNNYSINKFTGEVDELDNKFTKVRFHEYMRDLQRLLNRSGKRKI